MRKNILIIHMTGEQSLAARLKLDTILMHLLTVSSFTILSKACLENPETDIIDMGLAKFNMSDVAFGLMDNTNIKKTINFATKNPERISIQKSKIVKTINIYNVYINNKDAIEYETKYVDFFSKVTHTQYFKII